MKTRGITVALVLTLAVCRHGHADPIADLSARFWEWRAAEQPIGSDDIPRIERPAGFVSDWSATAIAQRGRDLAEYERQWRRLAPPSGTAIPDLVDYRLLGSAIARVRWELSVEQRWQRDPAFYVEETLGSLFLLLLPPPPFDVARQRDLVARMRRIPATLRAARDNLTDIRRPFAQLAVDALEQVAARLQRSIRALAPHLSAVNSRDLAAAMPAALSALEEYRSWLLTRLPDARDDSAIGRENYLYFLHDVALLPYTPEQLLAMSHQEWGRAVAFESYQGARLAGSTAPVLFASADAQIEAERLAELKIRSFLVDQRILTVPAWVHHYRNRLLPDYLEPLRDLSEADDFTGPSRLDQDGTRYIDRPAPNLGFFWRSMASDPRPIIVHEGVPGHYFQLCLGWRNPDPARRHYYDSGANEGIGFYAEEMMLQAGLFDDNPQTRGTIYSFMRLRALRVEVDVKLALGEFSLLQAADYLERTVPMDHATALAEAALFSSTPGQAISYQIGKIQITGMLADARRAQGSAFSLLAFNDFVWNNGNVPLSLQRWELLHDASEVPDVLAPPAVP